MHGTAASPGVSPQAAAAWRLLSPVQPAATTVDPSILLPLLDNQTDACRSRAAVGEGGRWCACRVGRRAVEHVREPLVDDTVLGFDDRRLAETLCGVGVWERYEAESELCRRAADSHSDIEHAHHKPSVTVQAGSG